MRRLSSVILAALVAAGLVGCAPQALDGADGADLISTLASTTTSPSTTPDDTETTPALESFDVFSGSVTIEGDYRLFALGAGSAGDQWEIVPETVLTSPLVVVLFDADQNLLMRSYMSYNQSLRHIVRANTSQVYLGVMPPVSGHGGSFSLEATLGAGHGVPVPAQQVVYLNFDGGQNIRVHTRDPISFAAFDATVIGADYAGHTQEMKDVIVEEMCADYEGFDVVFLSSDEGPPPAGVYSTVHFGGSEAGLLGLADNVDNYNQDPAQNALVYIENFAPYWTMQLTPDEMALMIANVASHELGHLLGLYHTRDPNDIMDTTGSAWDLAEDQSFTRGPLEASVFAAGWEDSPRLLAQTVGSKAGAPAKSLAWRKSAGYKAIRRFAREELRHSCGTCLALDHE
jgi:hypothetical protein